MAEALPRYRKAGVLLGDIPRLDFGDRRESARSSALLDERLGQLSQWALGEAADRAKDEGLQYGAENPVTAQQLRDGTAHFQPRGTVFGDAARSAQVQAITADIELESQSRINELKIGAERGTIGPVEARDEIQAMIDGTGKSLARIDPKASAKLRASLGVAGNSALLAITQAAIKRETENRKIAVDGWLNGVGEQVRGHIQAGDTIDPDTGAVITAQSRIDATVGATLREQLVNIGDDVYARQAWTRFDAAVKDARRDALVSIASSPEFARKRDGTFDPVGAVARLDKGDFGAYTAMFRAMPTKEQAEVRNALRAAAADRYTAEQHVNAEEKRNDELKVYGLVREFPTANPARSREILADLDTIGRRSRAITPETVNALIKSKREGGGQGKANEVGETRLKLDIMAGRIATPEQMWTQGLRYGVSPKQINEAIGFFRSEQREKAHAAERKINMAAGLVPGQNNIPQKRAEAKIAMDRELDQKYNLALEAHRRDPSKHPPPDREVIVDAIINRRREDPIVKGIENTLKTLNEQYGTSGATKKTGVTFTEDSDPDDVRRALKQAGVKDGPIETVLNELRSIERRNRQLNQLRN